MGWTKYLHTPVHSQLLEIKCPFHIISMFCSVHNTSESYNIVPCSLALECVFSILLPQTLNFDFTLKESPSPYVCLTWQTFGTYKLLF